MLAGLFWLAACGDAPPPAAGLAHAAESYPRVVLVTIDTLRADHVGCYGYPRDTTPFLDRLAAGGTRFEQALATMPHTAPSHASMLTGLAPLAHGLRMNGESLSADVPTLAEVFAQAGYATASILSVRFLAGAARGFEAGSAGPRSAEAVTDLAIDWLDRVGVSDRFFLWVHYYDVHDWFRTAATARERARVAWRAGEASGEWLARMHGWPLVDGAPVFDPPHWGLAKRAGSPVAPFWVRTSQEALAWIGSYDLRVAAVDREVERLFRHVEGLSPRASTLWIATSDHGEGLGGHGVYGHGRYLYQEQLRVPLILHASDGRLARGVVGVPVSLVDLAATIEELVFAGGERSARLPGDSLVPLLPGGGEVRDAPERLIFAERNPVDELREALGWRRGAMFSLQRGDLKYIEREGGEDEMYRLDADPGETRNLIADAPPEREELRRLLQARIAELRARSHDSLPDDGRYVEELRALGYGQ